MSVNNLLTELSAVMCDRIGQKSLLGSIMGNVLLWPFSPPRRDTGCLFLWRTPTNLNKIPRTARSRGYDQKCLCLFIRKKLRDHNSHSYGQILTGFSQLSLKTGWGQWFSCCPKSPRRNLWRSKWHFRHSAVFLSTETVHIWAGCKTCFVGGYTLGFPCG